LIAGTADSSGNCSFTLPYNQNSRLDNLAQHIILSQNSNTTVQAGEINIAGNTAYAYPNVGNTIFWTAGETIQIQGYFCYLATA
jgi:hypothetical protein